jgi:ribonuclease P protein component
VKTSSTPRFTFKKEERLSRKKLIDELFKNGSSFYLQPFKVLMLEKKAPLNPPEDETFPAQILISVSSKNFPRAVDRNKIKRLVREAYRLNKNLLYAELEKKNKKFILAFIYTEKKIEAFSLIQEKVVASLNKIISLL